MLLDLFGVVGALVVYAVMSTQAAQVLTARPHGEWRWPGSHFQAWKLIAAAVPAGIAASRRASSYRTSRVRGV